MELAERIVAILAAGGCAGHGITSVEPFPVAEAGLRDAVASGRSAGLGFTFRDPVLATRPAESFPWARSVVVAAMPYLPAAGSPASGGATGRVARFATSDHYRPLRSVLGEVTALLAREGHRGEVVVDDARLVDRAAAVRAGVGWQGSSTMVLVPGAGPWVLLGSVITDADLPVTAPMRRGCGTCSACLPACPTGAIVAPGVLDARRCLAATLQSPGNIPPELRALVGDRLYGCDDCLEACPPGDRLLATASGESGRIPLFALLAADDRTLRSRYPQFYLPRNEGRWLRRNALVVLGNTAPPGSLGVLAGYAGHRDPMLRDHAVWSLGRIGGPLARKVLVAVGARDPDPEVAARARRALQEGPATFGTVAR